MKDELMILLGCGLTALLITNACTSMYDDKDDDSDDGGCDGSRRRRRRSMMESEGFSQCSSSYDAATVMPQQQPVQVMPSPAEKFSVDYYSEPKRDPTTSPLMFSGLVNNEPYVDSDYVEMQDYLANGLPTRAALFTEALRVFYEKPNATQTPPLTR